MLSMCDCTQSWIAKRVAITNDKKKTCNPVASHHLLFSNKWLQPRLQHQVITMESIQWDHLDVFDKEIINWQQVCMFFHNNQALCQVRDDWGMLPLHYACYQNAPLWAIKFFIRIWSEGMKEVVLILMSLLVSASTVPHWRLHLKQMHQIRSSHI